MANDVRSRCGYVWVTVLLGWALLSAVADVAAQPPQPPQRPKSGKTHWVPKLTDTWQWQLSGALNTSYDVTVYDIDLFDRPATTIEQLHHEGRRVVCYFSAGSSESWRPDFRRFQAADMGAGLDGWPGERWLDTRSQNVRAIMADRVRLAASKGCDGVEPDNVDAYSNRNGLGLSADQQYDYNLYLAQQAHAAGLAVGLKNDVDQVRSLEAQFDFAVNESCHEYGECEAYAVFTAAGKPVFNAEYAARFRTNAASRGALCAGAKREQLHTLVLPRALNGSFRYSCEP